MLLFSDQHDLHGSNRMGTDCRSSYIPRHAPRNKAEYYRRWLANEFGNRQRNWLNGREMWESGFRNAVGLRYLTPGRTMIIPVPADSFQARTWPGPVGEATGFPKEVGGDGNGRIIQGYLTQRPGGLALRYDASGKSHGCNRVEGPDGANVSGSAALVILRDYVQRNDPASYEDLMCLLDLYEEVVAIEFSVFQRPCGLLNRRTIIWEVRAY